MRLAVLSVCVGLLWPAGLVWGFGEPEKVDPLGDFEKGIVDFAFSQLVGGETCQRELVKIIDFYKQMISGTQYIFHVSLAPANGNPSPCPENDGTTEDCKLVVWERPWENYKEVQWHNVTCTRDNDTINSNIEDNKLSENFTDTTSSSLQDDINPPIRVEADNTSLVVILVIILLALLLGVGVCLQQLYVRKQKYGYIFLPKTMHDIFSGGVY